MPFAHFVFHTGSSDSFRCVESVVLVLIKAEAKRRKGMTKKSTTKTHKAGSISSARSKSLGSVKTTAISRTKSAKSVVAGNAVTKKFVSAKTGRIVKSSPAKPNLSRESIRSAVNRYVNRDTRTGGLSD